MRKAKMVRVVVLALMVGVLSTSLVYAVDPPTVDGLLDESYLEFEYYPPGEAPGGGSDTLAPGRLWTRDGGDGYCYYAFVVDRGYNDNVFAEDDRSYLEQDGWTKGGHSFGDLAESDYGGFDIKCQDRPTATVQMDYINVCSGVYESGGYPVDTCGSAPLTPVDQAATSLHWNMTSSGWDGIGPSPEYNGDPEYHSPPYDWNDTPGQYWEYQMIYEFRIAKVGDTCCEVTQGGAHNSPSKNDDTLASLGDYVWYDEPDEDGLQNDTHGAVQNVTVYLYDASDITTPIRTTQTDASGYYIFNNLVQGYYYVQFDPATLPPGYDFTAQNVGDDDEIDSDADPLTGWTEEIFLPAGTHDPTWDAGIITGGGTAVTLSSFAAGSGMHVLALFSLGAALAITTGSIVWARRRRL